MLAPLLCFASLIFSYRCDSNFFLPFFHEQWIVLWWFRGIFTWPFFIFYFFFGKVG